jgi:hypothetical protein
MEHAVFYPGPDGAPAFRRFASLEEAVGLVEHLRNVEGVEDVSVQMLTPVPLAFRAYFRVEVPAVDVPAVPEQPVSEQPVPEQPVPEQLVPEQLVPEQVDAEVLEPVAVERMPAELMPAERMPMEPVAVQPDPVANGKRSLGFFAH